MRRRWAYALSLVPPLLVGALLWLIATDAFDDEARPWRGILVTLTILGSAAAPRAWVPAAALGGAFAVTFFAVHDPACPPGDFCERPSTRGILLVLLGTLTVCAALGGLLGALARWAWRRGRATTRPRTHL